MNELAIDSAVRLVLRGCTAAVLAIAAVHKLRDIGAFRAAVEQYQLVPPLWAVPTGALLIAAEWGLAVGVCLPRVGSVLALAAAALFVLYGAAMTVNLIRGRPDIDCGCSGPAGRQPISVALVARNVVLAGVAAAGALPVSLRQWHWLDALTVAAAVIALVALYAAADGLMANASRRTGWPIWASHHRSAPEPAAEGSGA